ncbi:conjugal transfer protein TraF [Gracilimonas sp.]|uniref:conjugal transfer protein TraF n=1 Tax=Gracilimonas sp. TaxID=1974203 RepID=UPI002871069C|nr:hypothetical protein [Gracilimonas sp.]
MQNFSLKILSSLILIALMSLLLTMEIQAQNGGFAGASSRIGYSARGMAMGNAMSAVTSEGAYAYYNPAQAALFFTTQQSDFTVGALKFDRVFQSTGVQLQLPPSAGISFSILRTGVKDIDGRTLSGYPTNMFDASEYQVSGNFGIRLSEKLNGGVGVKFNIADYHPDLDNATAFGIDVGLLYNINEHLNAAFSVKDLIANYVWNTSELYSLSQARDVTNEFPTRIILGLAYQADSFTVSGDFEIQSYTSETRDPGISIIGGTPTFTDSRPAVNTHSKQIRLGGSWLAHERLTLRGGWQLPDASNIDSWTMSSGFSIHLPFDVFSPSIDYAFVMEPNRISNMHIFSLRLNL